MSLINLFVAARTAIAKRRQQRRAYDELMGLDDRSLADLGLHRSQIPALVEGIDTSARHESVPDAVAATAFGRGGPRLATGHRWMPPI